VRQTSTNQIIRTLTYVLALLTISADTSAQTPTAFVGGGLVLSQWHVDQHYQGSPSITYHPSTTDSRLIGFGAEVGVFLSAHLAIGGEVRWPFQRADITSYWSYYPQAERIQSQYRETSVFGTVRGVWPVGRRGHVGVVGGGGLLIGKSLERIVSTRALSTGATASNETERQVSQSFFGTMFGGEFAVAINRRVSIVPDARLYIVNRGDVLKSNNPGVYLGLPITLFQSQIGVQIGL